MEKHEVQPVSPLLAECATTPQRPCRRYNHTMIGWKKHLVVYGGDGAPGYLDDLWYFDTVNNEWDRISLDKEQKSSRPGARAGHTASLWNNNMIVFGGWRGAHGFCDVWSCNLERREWTLLKAHVCVSGQESLLDYESEALVIDGSMIPFPRHWHTAAVWNDHLYIHGGYGPRGVVKNLWRFHLITHQWELVQTNGLCPAPRCRHSGVMIDSNRWMMLGGKDALGSYFNDIHIFDFTTSTWKQVCLLSPPLGHSWWNGDEIVRQFPTLHCQACTYDPKRGLVIITGGCDGDCVSFDSTIIIKRSSAASLVRHHPLLHHSIKPLQLFDEWSRDERTYNNSLPTFINANPEPYSDLILQFL
eukprot:Blabericola_migrator_1__13046@NODE_878_length_6197_cov_81_643556_g621_i0_p3_GENE_NODE_878_length_6197_cov_81_643556_g621_i0NODE_878_length_6197_cov_81_643556_g621_i0_p3_ORF_typecomplete_len359_score45_23Kelch_4/PF13418_6/2_8e10Kelch_4/PF13418_6/1_5e07Kelch_4/PF13418_6/3_4e08Kelch_4/PF13418_6/2e11Kelch_4/PF13418_6/6_2Kelch_6/PF13964_6/2_4e09Kelch_6/PF13964_6/2_6e07Kelch_6/PF13964_6/1_3e10Kelch_6/PF13964_6/1_1e07Kelch_6/PF13964_6/3_7e02Kelch_3/PF13415_6/2_8e02Kelch_3/PF13415_6/4_8e10Kelch_3/PF1341